MTVSRHFFLIAAERSGDIHGGMLMRSILKINPGCHFTGIGGPSMEAQGLKSLFPINKMAVVGFVEVIKHLRFFKEVESSVLAEVANNPPDQIILIDFPGFNLRIARKIKEQYQIPTTYYISPQIWAWKENRIKIIKKHIDQMLVILPFEKEWYAKHNMDTEWVGHPYLDYTVITQSKNEFKSQYGIENNNLLLTLFPGSRQQEVDNHMPLFTKVYKALLDKNNNLKIGIGLAPGIKLKQKYQDITVIENEDSHQLLAASDLLLTASGTATLEAAILGIPMAVIYKLNIITWMLSKAMVKIRYISLPNIILDKAVVPEFIQSHAKPDRIVEYIQKMIDNSELRESTGLELSSIKDVLGEPGASDRAAEKILNYEG